MWPEVATADQPVDYLLTFFAGLGWEGFEGRGREMTPKTAPPVTASNWSGVSGAGGVVLIMVAIVRLLGSTPKVRRA